MSNTDNTKPVDMLEFPLQCKSPTPRSSKSDNAPLLEVDLNTLLKFIKPYNGSKDTLNSFLLNCNNAYDMATEAQRPIIFKYILCQLEGKAEIACSIKEFKKWPQLKDFLKTQFSERKHYSHLLADLQETRQMSNESVTQYSLRVETCLSQLLTEISLSDTTLKELPGRIAAMEDLALHHFTIGLNPRVSNIVRCRAPKNLNQAINIAVSEERIQQCIFKRSLPSEARPNITNRPRFSPRPQWRNPDRLSGYPQPQPGPSRQSEHPFCRYCKTLGHDIKDCKKREYNNRNYQAQPRTFIPNQRPSYFDRNRAVHFVDQEEPEGRDEVDHLNG